MPCLPPCQTNPPGELPVTPPAPTGTSGGGGSASWSEIQGKPSTFPPSSHTHVIADVAGLQASLDSAVHFGDLAPVASSGLYADLTGIPASFTPTAHTHPSSQISDSTPAGQALLTAVDAAAQRVALGLGTLATQSGTVSGTNTGDQTSIVGITGTKAQFDAAVTDGNVQWVGDAPTAHTHLLAAGATDVTITAANLNALDDGANTALHFHDSDRARANHTGTQAASTITGLAMVATSGSATDLTAGTVPAARFDDASHGARAGGALHAVATPAAAGFLSAADKTKLDGMALGATANSPDATLLDRSNHTGVQGQATVTGLVADLAAKAPNAGATLTGATVNGVTLSSGAGLLNFLRGDGTYAPVIAPPTVLTITVPVLATGYAEVVVADAGVTVLSVINADFVGELDAENDIEGLADDQMRLWPVAEAGQIRFVLTGNGAFVGAYKIKYGVAA